MNRRPGRLSRCAAGIALMLLATQPAQAASHYVQASIAAYPVRPSGSQNALMLTALHTVDGLKWKTWDRTTGNWSNWMVAPFPANAQPFGSETMAHFPLVSWPESGSWRSNGYYRETSRTTLGAPWWTAWGTNLNFDHHPIPADSHGSDFQPASGIARLAGANHLHFFGQTFDDPACNHIGLRERWWDGDLGRWQWVYHGCPDSSAVGVGQQAAVTTRPPGAGAPLPGVPVHNFVFVTASPPSGPSSIWVRHTSAGRGSSWLSLGVPAGTSMVGVAPLAFAHDRGDGVWRTHVFVSALNTADRRWHLYEKFVDTGTDYADWARFQSGWADHGRPLDLDGLAPSGRFGMTSAVVRRPGGQLRISLFGSSFYSQPSGQLLEYTWDGGSWRWAPSVRAPATGADGRPLAVRVTSSAAFNDDLEMSVITIDEAQDIWERSMDSLGGWAWIRH